MANGRTITAYKHIELTEDGQAVLAGSRIKVKYLAAEYTALGCEPDVLLDAHPHLTLGQILSALAYYYDHKEELDTKIQDDYEQTERVRSAQQPFSALAKLQALKAVKFLRDARL